MPASARAAAAARRTGDTTPPSVPTGLVESLLCQTTFRLGWTASTDNVAVTGYKIFKGGALHVDTMSTATTRNITGQTAGASATWTVSAYDAEGNESSQSSGLVVSQTDNVTSFSCSNNYAARNTACSNNTDNTYYHDGGLSTPGNGDIIYTDACADNPLNGVGGEFYSDGNVSFTVTSSGVVGSVELCTI